MYFRIKKNSIEFIIHIYLGFRFWWAMIYHRNSLPKETTLLNPIMETEGMSWAVFWEDEGMPNPSYNLTRAFVYVFHYRTSLIVGNSGNIPGYGPKNFNKLMFRLAKYYFPDWIGFDKNRCSYNPELASRILRIHKVSKWQLDKLLDES